MPFTPSHVAAVIPLILPARARRVLDPWALAVGAMVPDLPMFLPYLDDYAGWHSPRGVVTKDVAATVVLLALFQFVFRQPLTALLPERLARRVAALPGPGWRRFPTVLLGAAAGAATHVLWDSFTHDWGTAFWSVPLLSAPIAGGVTGYQVLQYASSAAGLAAVAWWLATWLRTPGSGSLPAGRPAASEPPCPPPRRAGAPPAAAPSAPAPSGTGPSGSGPSAPVPSRAGPSGSASSGSAASGAAPSGSSVRRAVPVAAVVAGLVAAPLWPLVHPPGPASGWGGLLARGGAGLVIGCCAVLTLYAGAWWLRRAIRWKRA
ncbi:hypothetical protein Sru01_34310 [Sphaerisporangium rufum]|uniref:DUF4184 family protein n=1 Tax=Sphaerisporangium rufum TaxID=1381558 RepID=A0A919V062_9ACTN|nr:DUF4184 family protein [Sphaerisporangium rufum]GII78449.1 hypothetical protein Sru01_34310 [Sphaerisporangium rufum]